MSAKIPFPLHTLLIALYFPAFLYSQNIHRFHLSVVALPTAVVVGCALAGWALFRLVLGDGRKAGLFVSANLLIFFSYGYAFGYLKAILPRVESFQVGSNYILLSVWILANIGCATLIRARTVSLDAITAGLNKASAVLLATPIVLCGYFLANHMQSPTVADKGDVEAWVTAFHRKGSDRPLPDVYHIVMDAYSREDVLRDAFGFDNSSFISFLAAKGFSIGSRSNANYPITNLSLTSTLNFNYLDSLLEGSGPHSLDRTQIARLRNEAKAIRLLKGLGYRYIVVTNGWEIGDLSADDILAPGWSPKGLFLNEYENGLLAMSPLPLAFRELDDSLIGKNAQHRKRISFALKTLENIPMEKGPKYVYCHILAPHTPIVFGPEGEPLDDVEDLNLLRKSDHFAFKKAVVGEISYLNKRLEKIVSGILAASKGNAVILLHSDHGESVMDAEDGLGFHRQRHGILAALHLPGGGGEFYDSMSSVNFFRHIFRTTYGMDMEILPDRLYHSPDGTTFGLREITESLKEPR